MNNESPQTETSPNSWPKILSELMELGKHDESGELDLLITVIEADLLGKEDDFSITVSGHTLTIAAGEDEQAVIDKLMGFIEKLKKLYLTAPPQEKILIDRKKEYRRELKSILIPESLRPKHDAFWKLYNQLCAETKVPAIGFLIEDYDQEKKRSLVGTILQIVRKKTKSDLIERNLARLHNPRFTHSYEEFIDIALDCLQNIQIQSFLCIYREFCQKIRVDCIAYGPKSFKDYKQNQRDLIANILGAIAKKQPVIMRSLQATNRLQPLDQATNFSERLTALEEIIRWVSEAL